MLVMRMATAVVTRSGDVPGGTTGDVAGSRREACVIIVQLVPFGDSDDYEVQS
jgi:hypothetical protein